GLWLAWAGPDFPNSIWGGLALSTADLFDFGRHGPLLPPSGLSPSYGVWNIAPRPSTTLGAPPLPRTRNRPSVVSSYSLHPSRDVIALEPQVSVDRPAGFHATLHPTPVISTQTRHRKAVAADKPLPPVDDGFSDDPSPASRTDFRFASTALTVFDEALCTVDDTIAAKFCFSTFIVMVIFSWLNS
ncbi:unnamed protein product, partial [Ectocarpus sp. 13 AM-2016]